MNLPELENPTLLTENIAPDTSTHINTNFMEQRLVNTQSAYPHTSSHLSQAVEQEMADGSWFAKQQLMKPIQVGQYDWTVSQNRGDNVADFSIPQILSQSESLTLRTLRMYSFYKLSPVIRIQINSTQFHQGQLIAAFDPFSFTYQSKDIPYNIYYATGLPHVKIMASESDSVELKLPFTHPRSFLTTNVPNIFNNLGHFYLTVMNPLIVAEGTSPTVSVTIWIYSEEAQVHVPIYDHDPILEPVVATSGEAAKPVVPSETPSTSTPKKSTFELIKQGFKQGTDLVGNFMTLQFGQGLRKGQGLIDTLGELFGFDYPSDPISPQKHISPLENLAVGKGKSRSQRMAIDPYSLHKIDDTVAAESISAMGLLNIAKMPMLLSQFNFSSTNAKDDLIFSTPVHPQMSAQFPDGTVQRTYLSFVSNAFTYWSGGIKFDIEVVATRFHSGKILVAYVPNQFVVPSYQQATLLPNVIIDIQQTSNTTFTVPFTSSTAMKSTILPANPNSNQYVDASTGSLVIYVQNILTHASNVAPSIEINIYEYAAEDFSLYVPRRPALNIPPPEPEGFVQVTSGISIMSDQPSHTSAVLSKDQDRSIARKHFGEEYNLLDLLRRFSYFGTIKIVPEDNSKAFQPLVYVAPFNGTSLVTQPNNVQTYLSYFSNIYSCWVGTMRYKLTVPASRTDTHSILIFHSPDPLNLDVIDERNLELNLDPFYPSNGYASLYTNLSQDNAIEFEVPYYSKYNMLLNQAPEILSFDLTYISNGVIYYANSTGVEKEAPSEDIYDIKIFQAAGEDFRFIYLRPPPVTSTSQLFFISSKL